MARIAYEKKQFKPETLAVIVQAERICREYQEQGFDLTLRQLYYQFVSRDLIPNRQSEYKRLGSIVNDARMAGALDWDYIVDRTRSLEGRQHYDSPAHRIDIAARSYARDLWADQRTRVEVWIEKDALTGVIEPTCRGLDVSYFSCRGYSSQSEMWAAGQRLGAYIAAGQRVVILHMGDHDPSGLDMTRDIASRLRTFTIRDFLNDHAEDFPGEKVGVRGIELAMALHCGITEQEFDAGARALEVRRIALTMDQVEEYEPPPNPAKTTDARFRAYEAQYGDESWELDALEPTVLAELIREAVHDLQDPDVWNAHVDRENAERAACKATAARWDEIVELLGEAS